SRHHALGRVWVVPPGADQGIGAAAEVGRADHGDGTAGAAGAARSRRAGAEAGQSAGGRVTGADLQALVYLLEAMPGDSVERFFDQSPAALRQQIKRLANLSGQVQKAMANTSCPCSFLGGSCPSSREEYDTRFFQRLMDIDSLVSLSTSQLRG